MEEKETENIVKIINGKFPAMSRGQRKLAEYILAQYDKAAFLTAAQIGKQVGVSESTVVRFAGLLGYKGFPQMQKALEGMVYKRLHEAPAVDIENENISGQEVLEQILKKDIRNISNTLEMADRRTFEMAVEKLLNARHVYLVGIRGSEPLAVYMGFYLKLMLDEVTVVSNGNTSDLFEELMKINEEDCLVGISFPRYSMRTLKAIEFANSRSVSVITITDSINSPMNLYSSCNLIARSDMTAAADSLCAPMSLVNALITAVMAKRRKNLLNRLEMLEDICNQYGTGENDELNKVDDSDCIGI
ncbi:MAG: MurR/RpiR family transcriptional regulator [Lachnospiraceae bacterium]|mgnify:FL=1|jgi:DNA-binding MurR/RpiR family transcriptional regulator